MSHKKSTLNAGLSYGNYHWSQVRDIMGAFEEVLDFHFALEFWIDRTARNLGDVNCSLIVLGERLNQYEVLLFNTIRELEVLGLVIEPSDDDSSWRGWDHFDG